MDHGDSGCGLSPGLRRAVPGRDASVFSTPGEAVGHPHSTLLLVGGKLVHERYFAGYDAAVPHDLRSATKSLTALVTMMAIERGHLTLGIGNSEQQFETRGWGSS